MIVVQEQLSASEREEIRIVDEAQKRAASEFCDVLTAAIDQLKRIRGSVMVEFDIIIRHDVPANEQAMALVERMLPDLDAVEKLNLKMRESVASLDQQGVIGGWRENLVLVTHQNTCYRIRKCWNQVVEWLRSGMPKSKPSSPPWHGE